MNVDSPPPTPVTSSAPPPDYILLWRRFHVRVTALYGGLLFAVLTAMSVFFYWQVSRSEFESLQTRLRVAAVAIASAIPPETIAALRQPDDRAKPEYKQLIARFQEITRREPDFSSIYVLRPNPSVEQLAFVADFVTRGDAPAAAVGDAYDGTQAPRLPDGFAAPTAEQEPYHDPWGTVLSGYAPVRDAAGATVAVVGVDVQLAHLDGLQRRVRLVALSLFAAAALALAAVAAYVARYVETPLQRIVDATAAIAAGQFSVRAAMDRDDEFGVVGRRFDAMAAGLAEREFIKSTFGAYVSPEVVRKVLDERKGAVAGQRRQVTVLFADIRGFTSLCERMPPEQVVRLLNSYLDRMTEVLNAHGARIDKFIGDAIMADWGALDDAPDAAARAVRAALEMGAALNAFNETQRSLGHLPLTIGIGIHSGEAISGTIGSQRKLEFTVVGDTVNVASRLEAACKRYGEAIVVSRAVADAAADVASFRRLDEVQVSGREEPIEIFTPAPLSAG